MPTLIKILTPEWVRGLMAMFFGIGVIVGFFMGLVPVSEFMMIAGVILGYYFRAAQEQRQVKVEVAKEVDKKLNV